MISLKQINLELKKFALKDITLDVKSGDYFLLVGPTGAGKTLLLETIAGLNKVTSGEIRIDDRDVTSVEPEGRNIGIVYQDCALFPHLSVAENILFGLRVRKQTGLTLKKTLGEMSSLLGIEHLLGRKPGRLSGGEKQKVALARCLAIRPRLLLLDEPFSALDPETREGLQQEVKRIQQELNITVIHVTHDFSEAMIIGKHIAVIGEGRIRQIGTPEEIFRHPDSEFVARFTRMRNIIPGQLVKREGGLHTFRSGINEFAVPTTKEAVSHACIRPDDIILSTDLSSPEAVNTFVGTITGIEDRGMESYIMVNMPPEICCLLTGRMFSEMGLTIGQKVKIILDPEYIHVF